MGYPYAYGYPYYPYGYGYGTTIIYNDPAPVTYGDQQMPSGSFEPAPAQHSAPAPRDPPVQFRYYCPHSGQYYPAVKTCPQGWQQQPQT